MRTPHHCLQQEEGEQPSLFLSRGRWAFSPCAVLSPQHSCHSFSALISCQGMHNTGSTRLHAKQTPHALGTFGSKLKEGKVFVIQCCYPRTSKLLALGCHGNAPGCCNKLLSLYTRLTHTGRGQSLTHTQHLTLLEWGAQSSNLPSRMMSKEKGRNLNPVPV